MIDEPDTSHLKITWEQQEALRQIIADHSPFDFAAFVWFALCRAFQADEAKCNGYINELAEQFRQLATIRNAELKPRPAVVLNPLTPPDEV